jgi:hypothetical protein
VFFDPSLPLTISTVSHFPKNGHRTISDPLSTTKIAVSGSRHVTQAESTIAPPIIDFAGAHITALSGTDFKLDQVLSRSSVFLAK